MRRQSALGERHSAQSHARQIGHRALCRALFGLLFMGTVQKKKNSGNLGRLTISLARVFHPCRC